MFVWKLENSYWWMLSLWFSKQIWGLGSNRKYLNCLSQHLRSTHKTTIPHLQLKLKMLWQQTCVCLLFSIFLGNHDSEASKLFMLLGLLHPVLTLGRSLNFYFTIDM
uniref:Uncharacterized protein n=1 Tax=Strix occidentalis caurina TaxID=311401 RepID=A0A8D0FIK5_STROC